MGTLLAALLAVTPHDLQVVATGGPGAQLDYGQPVACVKLAPTPEVPSGRWRVQCDESRRACLAAPDAVLVDGVESPEGLARARYCSPEGQVDQAMKERWPLVRARADVEPGWYRDERGRVMQVDFDLGRRVYVGGAWAPAFSSAGRSWTTGRAEPAFGVDVSWTADSDTELHRLHLLSGRALLGDVTRLEATLVSYDSTRKREQPPVRVTTFFGRPRRLDLDLNLSWAAELLRLDSVGGVTFISPVAGDLVLDVWHSSDLESYFRVRVGPAAEMEFPSRALFLRGGAAVEAHLVLGDHGFHHLTARARAEQLYFAPPLAGRGALPSRLEAQAGWEFIVLAVNDYPLSLFAEGRARWRDDLFVDGVQTWRGWEFQGLTGARFSLWAPPRHAVER